MPAPKIDFSTPHGRLQYAREQQGIEQVQFGFQMGYKGTGWGKIERGERKLTCEQLIKANSLLPTPLPIGYYFGEVEYTEAVSGKMKDFNDIVKSMEEQSRELRELKFQVQPAKETDPLARRVVTDEVLSRIVKKMLPLRQYFPRIEGYLEGLSEAQKGEHGGTASA